MNHGRLLVVATILLTSVGPASASPILSMPYLGITRPTDSISLPGPGDQTPGSGLGAHTAKINLIAIDLTAPGFAASNGSVHSAFEATPLATPLVPSINVSATNVAHIVNVGGTQTTLAGGIVPYSSSIAVFANPVPEPSTLILFGQGVVLITAGAVLRRLRRPRHTSVMKRAEMPSRVRIRT